MGGYFPLPVRRDERVSVQSLKGFTRPRCGLIKGGVCMNGKQRNLQKRDITLSFLAKFGFSTRTIICALLKVKVNAQKGFFDSLVSQGLVEIKRIPAARHEIITITQEGLRAAEIIDAGIKVKAIRKFSLPYLIHTYSIQSFIATNINVVKEWYSESEMADMRFYRRPDLLYRTDKFRAALEIELNRKAADRVYYNYQQHIQDWQQGRFDFVDYRLADENMLNFYKSLHDKGSWPLYKLEGVNLRAVEQFDPSAAKRAGLFNFRINHPYSL